MITASLTAISVSCFLDINSTGVISLMSLQEKVSLDNKKKGLAMNRQVSQDSLGPMRVQNSTERRREARKTSKYYKFQMELFLTTSVFQFSTFEDELKILK